MRSYIPHEGRKDAGVKKITTASQDECCWCSSGGLIPRDLGPFLPASLPLSQT